MQGISHWYFEALRRWSEIAGRSRRMEYWTFSLMNPVIGFVVILIGSLSNNETVLKAVIIALLFFYLLLIIPSFTITIRRLHDIGKSGLWFLIVFIPIIGPIILFIFTIMGSQSGTNQYGPNPKEANQEAW